MDDITNANPPLVSSISSTLLRLLPHMNPSTNGDRSTSAQSDIRTGDNLSMSTDTSCSSCNSSCSSFVNEHDVLGRYRLVKTLGVGEFGKVKLGIHIDTEEKVAIKIVKKQSAGTKLAKVEREIQILKALHHPHVVKLIEVIETDTRVGIVLEYALGGELFEYVWSHKSLEEDTAKSLFGQLISAVNHMHLKEVVHRDLKLENLLFLDTQQTHLVISDFGFSSKENNNILSTCCGSPTYAAPELIYPFGTYNGATADVWSCGVILFCMICGYLPFDDDPENPESANLRRLYQHIRSSTLSFPEFVSDAARDLIQQMLRPDPMNRCTIQDVIEHTWLRSFYSTRFGLPLDQLGRLTLDSNEPQNSAKPQEPQQQQNLDSTLIEYVEKHTTSQKKRRASHSPLEDHHHRHRHHDSEHRPLVQQSNDHQDVAIQTEGASLRNSPDTMPPTPRSLMAVSKMSSCSETNNTISTMSASRIQNKDLPLLPSLPPLTPEEEDALNDFGHKEHQRNRKPSLRRQKKFRPSVMDTQPVPLLPATMKNDYQGEWTDDESSTFGIHPSLLGKDSSTYNKRTNMGSADGGTVGNGVQNMKSISLPLLNQANHIGKVNNITISTTNLNDDINEYNSSDQAATETKKRRKRFTSFLSKTHSGPRPQRSQSTRMIKKNTFDDDNDDQETTLQQKATSASTITTTTTTPVARRKTMTQTMRAWLHKKRPFTKHQSSSFSSLSRSSSSSAESVGVININHDQQQSTPNSHRGDHQQYQQQQHQEQQQEAHHYLIPSTAETTPTDQSMMRTFTHAQGEHLTSMAPGQLILTLVRVLTALGFDVQHHSSYQLTCLRKSHHPHHSFYSWHHGSTRQKKKNNNTNKTTTVSTAPIYGPPNLDDGQDIEFTVEVCRSLLTDIYVVDIQHVCGDLPSFQFLKSKLLSLLNLNA